MDLYKAPPGAIHNGTAEERAAWWAWYQSTQAARDKQSDRFGSTAAISMGATLLLPMLMMLVVSVWHHFTR